MNKDERINKIDEAKEKLSEAYDLVTEAVEDLNCRDNVKAYWLDQLKVLIDSGHDFLTKDKNLDDVVDQIQEEEYSEVDEISQEDLEAGAEHFDKIAKNQKKELSKIHAGAFCNRCFDEVTEAIYSKGECPCGGDVVTEEELSAG